MSPAALRSGYTSDELFHLVGRCHPTDHEANYDTLLKVLADGCISHPPHRPDWGTVSYVLDMNESLTSGKLIVPTVICFCDIPLKKLGLHTRKYGMFGLSFKREFLVQYGARPVTYVPISKSQGGGIHGLTFLKDIEAVHRGFRRQLGEPSNGAAPPSRPLGTEPKTPEAAIAALRSVFEKDMLAFIQPFDADLQDSDVNNYYLEREWRMFGNLRFDFAAVHRVLVAPGFQGRLTRDAASYVGKVVVL
jgi:hypothetical protein